ncbi:hypothetical protein L4X63_21790 [Geomonas sp. Red32]|uniref:L,D-transpeptidase Cds6 family protein n=1 Tax=Geomonas sp. Red32 TaxID=2912856 RepID=UPI00202CC5FF|nr:hypothetical protein [Geomonas sp. Red32]MCM0084219.1 hypothetical protein [Geomonas sp. Red32]
MNIFIALIITLIMTAPSFAADLTEKELEAFLAEWVAAQNSGAFEKYASMYSKQFSGIRRSGGKTVKLDNNAWLKDRRKMFQKRMVVQAINPEIVLDGQKSSLKFEQVWESSTYKDRGNKLLIVAVEKDGIKIVSEEMMDSKVDATQNKASKERLGAVPATPLVTSIDSSACKKLPQKIAVGFDKLGLYADECPAPTGWRLFLVVGGDRSWIDLGHDHSVWTTEQEVVYNDKNFFGFFPNVTSKQVEWVVDGNDAPIFLIFPVTAQDPQKAGHSVLQYFVVTTQGIPRFCGTAKTIKEAEKITGAKNSCPPLSKRPFSY